METTVNRSTTQTKRYLGEILVDHGIISALQLEEALAEHTATKRRLGEVLLMKGWLFPADLYRALAEQHEIEIVDLDTHPPDPILARRVPESLARRLMAIPVGEIATSLKVAMAEPFDVFAIDDLRAATGQHIAPVLAEPDQLQRVINSIYTESASQLAVKEATEDADSNKIEDLSSLTELHDDGPIVKFIDLLLRRAVAEGCSDIHVEATPDGLRIRFRVDGVLRHVMDSPKSIQSGVISRLKIMSDMDIAEKRIPQDGRIAVKVSDRVVDLRVVTVPTVHGESVVLRILDQGSNELDIDQLGFHPRARKRFEWAFRKPAGGILVTGPTGSGKTTTLYSTLAKLNEPHRAIVTVEDPVEYRIEGLKQMQMNSKAGLTFASSLRAILRADPDVVLVGEIRDLETAAIACEAAITGHLLLSTLHTNDAASAPLRLIEMGVEPFMVTAAISCVVAQRLVRRLCVHCSIEYTPTPEELKAAGWTEALLADADVDIPNWRQTVGCTKCNGNGYKGRFGVYEVMLLSPNVQQHVLARSSTAVMKQQAVKEGMLTMRQDGLIKAAQGTTTLKELARAVA
ncbi:MAG: type IV pilus assembly protein PilB [Candidatus Poriferisodalaceae bacterium]|jgi:type IV pilus assembly protein PilB